MEKVISHLRFWLLQTAYYKFVFKSLCRGRVSVRIKSCTCSAL